MKSIIDRPRILYHLNISIQTTMDVTKRGKARKRVILSFCGTSNNSQCAQVGLYK